MFRTGLCLLALVTSLSVLLMGCRADDSSTGTEPPPSRLSVPVPAEELTITAPVRNLLGAHAVELGGRPTLVIVVEGVPPSLRPGHEVRATGSVRTFRQELGTELGVPLNATELQRFEGVESVVVARLVVLRQ